MAIEKVQKISFLAFGFLYVLSWKDSYWFLLTMNNTLKLIYRALTLHFQLARKIANMN